MSRALRANYSSSRPFPRFYGLERSYGSWLMAAFNQNVARAAVIQRFRDQLLVNTLYFANTGNGSFTWSEANLNDLAQGLSEYWQTNMLANQAQGVTLQGADTYSLASSEAPSGSFRFGTPPAGALTGDGPPNNIALSVSFRTGGRGRTSRGRNYFGGWVDADVQDNNFVQSRVDAIVAAYDGIRSQVFVPQTAWCVYSQFFEGAERPEGIFRFVTTVLAVDTIVDSQRRRLPGRGSV